MKIKHLSQVFAGCALIALASLTASAQVGRLEGDVVKADTKEPVVGAEVQIERTDIKGSYPVKTDKKGHFLHAGVPLTGTYTILVSAPGCAPTFLTNVRAINSEPVKIELSNGDGKKLTMADVKGIQSSAPKGGGQQMSAADQKKAQEEYEKKRAEILQMATLKPEIAILDETDSGLDIDALRIVSEGVNTLMNKDMGVLVITHYQRLLNYIKPDHVHVMLGGRIVESGGPELALHLEEKGYDWVREKYEEATA